MLTKRVIPCLDVTDGRVVKGVRFQDLRPAGNPVDLAAAYDREGADELVFLDVGASPEGRRTLLEVVTATARRTFIPLTVGGGIRTLEDVRAALRAGADKVSINTAAVRRPQLIDETAGAFGSQCIVLAVDARRSGQSWEVCITGGRTRARRDAIEWAVEGTGRGAGEILLTSMDADGTRQGYDLGLLRAVSDSVHVPVIASGGAGHTEDFVKAVQEGHADAVLAASLFHYRQLSIADVKRGLAAAGIAVRLEAETLRNWKDGREP